MFGRLNGHTAVGVSRSNKEKKTKGIFVNLYWYMFTINRTIVSEAYGSYRARFPPCRPKGLPTDTSRKSTPIPITPPEFRKYTPNDHKSDSDPSPNSKLNFTHQPQPKIKVENAQTPPPLQHHGLSAELDSTDKMTTLRSTESGVPPQGPHHRETSNKILRSTQNK